MILRIAGENQARMMWRVLIGAGVTSLVTLIVATLAALEGWLTYGRGAGRVTLHAAMLAAGSALFGFAFALRRRGQGRLGAAMLGLLAALALPYAAMLGVSAYLFAFAAERF